MAAAPELEPVAAFTLRRLLVPLSQVVGFAVAFGMCVTVDRIARAFFGTAEGAVGWIPWVGDLLTQPIHKVEQKITAALGSWANGADAHMGDALHQLAAVIRQVGDSLRYAHLILYDVVKLLGTFLDYRSWMALYKTLVGYDHAHLERIKRLERGAGAQAKATTHASKVAAHAAATTATLPGVIGHEWDIPGLRERVKAVEDGATRTWKWITSHGKSVAAGAFAGAVAFALGKLGASWIRCRNWRSIGQRVCATDPLAVEDWLAGLLALAGTVSVVAFVEELQAVESEMIDALRLFIREMP